MKITLTDNDNGKHANAEVADADWVQHAIDCAFNWMRYNGSGSVTAREADAANGNPRIATVALEIHDE